MSSSKLGSKSRRKLINALLFKLGWTDLWLHYITGIVITTYQWLDFVYG